MEQDLRRKEQEAVRQAVGIYDFTHQLLEVCGEEAGRFLDKIFVNGFSKAKIGQAKYTTMLNESGEILDDVIIFRISETEYWISTLALDAMTAHFDAHRTGEKVAYRDRTPETSMIAVQGPASRQLLQECLKDSIEGLKRFYLADNQLGEQAIKVARSGFTGERGYELYVQPDTVEAVLQTLEQTGQAIGVPVRRMTTDVILTSLPREKGYVLMSDLEGTNPLEVGFAWTVDWSKDFIGKAALERVRRQGPRRALLGFRTEALPAIVPGSVVKKEGTPVGKVTMFTESLTLGGGIGYALVETASAPLGTVVEIDGVKTTLVPRTFYDPEDARIR